GLSIRKRGFESRRGYLLDWAVDGWPKGVTEQRLTPKNSVRNEGTCRCDPEGRRLPPSGWLEAGLNKAGVVAAMHTGSLVNVCRFPVVPSRAFDEPTQEFAQSSR